MFGACGGNGCSKLSKQQLEKLAFDSSFHPHKRLRKMTAIKNVTRSHAKPFSLFPPQVPACNLSS